MVAQSAVICQTTVVYDTVFVVCSAKVISFCWATVTVLHSCSEAVSGDVLLQVAVELKEAAKPLELPYQSLSSSQQPPQLAAHQLAPNAALLAVSSTSNWAAVASSNHVHIFDLGSMSYHGRLPALQVRHSRITSS